MAPWTLDKDPTPLEVIISGPTRDTECEATTLEIQRQDSQSLALHEGAERQRGMWECTSPTELVLRERRPGGDGFSSRGAPRGGQDIGSMVFQGPARGVEHSLTSTRLYPTTSSAPLPGHALSAGRSVPGLFCLFVSPHSFPSGSEVGSGYVRTRFKCTFGFTAQTLLG